MPYNFTSIIKFNMWWDIFDSTFFVKVTFVYSALMKLWVWNFTTFFAVIVEICENGKLLFLLKKKIWKKCSESGKNISLSGIASKCIIPLTEKFYTEANWNGLVHWKFTPLSGYSFNWYSIKRVWLHIKTG